MVSAQKLRRAAQRILQLLNQELPLLIRCKVETYKPNREHVRDLYREFFARFQ